MTAPKISIIGKLRLSETEGVQYPITIGKGKKQRTVWLEAMPNAYDWPGIPKDDDRAKYLQGLHADAGFQAAAKDFIELQRREPQGLLPSFWAYKDFVLQVITNEPKTLYDKDRDTLLVKHYILRRERDYERIKREVEVLENLDNLDGAAREPIPEAVRLFVWQRDGGKCVKCGNRELLEFDHIIPVVKGGSNTERNLQLLCEPCNRSKGSTI
jgi:HNH endonuclease